MTKAERDELRRLLRGRFKMLRSDVAARRAELEEELRVQVEQHFAAMDKAYDDAMYQLRLAVDEANRKANDLGRQLHGVETWGAKFDRQIVQCQLIPKPGLVERNTMLTRGHAAIENRVRKALLELDRQENELLTDLATSALESAEAKAFFERMPTVSELVPAYRINRELLT